MPVPMKERFLFDYEDACAEGPMAYMVVIVRLPSSSREMIVNTQDFHSKFNYYMSAYDDDFRLLNNPEIQIVKWMFA